MSIKYGVYSYLIHTFTNTYMISKPRVLRHLLYDVHITTTQTPPYKLKKTARSLLPIVHLTHPYYTANPRSAHHKQHT